MMGRTRTKTCPDCFNTVSASTLICVCGGTITSNRRNSKDSVPPQRRRTERTKRGKPDFYDALEYDRQAKKEKKRKIQGPSRPPPPQKEPTPPPPQRMQLNVNKKFPDPADEPELKEEELEEIVLSEEKIAKFSLILDEINRKICAASWRGLL